jgi:hypothetical protein
MQSSEAPDPGSSPLQSSFSSSSFPCQELRCIDSRSDGTSMDGHSRGNTSPSRRAGWNVNRANQVLPVAATIEPHRVASSNSSCDSQRHYPLPRSRLRKRRQDTGDGRISPFRRSFCSTSYLKCVPILALVLWVYTIISATSLVRSASQTSVKGWSGLVEMYTTGVSSNSGLRYNAEAQNGPNHNLPVLSYRDLTKMVDSMSNMTIILPVPNDVDANFIRHFESVQSTHARALLSVSCDTQNEYLKKHGRSCLPSFLGVETIRSREWRDILFQSCFLHQHGGFYINLKQANFVYSVGGTMDAISALLAPADKSVALVRNEMSFKLDPSMMLFLKPGHHILTNVLEKFDMNQMWLGKEDASVAFAHVVSDAYDDYATNASNMPVLLRQSCLSICPDAQSSFCCHVSLDAGHLSRTLFTTRRPQTLQIASAPSQTGESFQEERSVSKLLTEVHERPMSFPQSTPNFYHVMRANDCLPTNRHCRKCLAEAGACTPSCRKLCPCYCTALCRTDIHDKFISRTINVVPPEMSKSMVLENDATLVVRNHGPNKNFIPKIVHQIWIEPASSIMGENPHPEMSRIINTWKQTGWEHIMYSLDEDIPLFLNSHFPPEISEAYNSIVPRRFKSDFARLCLLLIHGGIYADPDVLLSVNLENAIPNDAGFIAAMDFVRPKVSPLPWGGIALY